MPELNKFENLTALDKSIGRDRAAVSSSGNTGGHGSLGGAQKSASLRALLATQVSRSKRTQGLPQNTV